MTLIDYTNIEDGLPVTANTFNTRFGKIVSTLNGNLDATNFSDGGIPVEAISVEVYSKMYPIGSVYINATNDANPLTLFGFGTWVAFGAGRVPVGIDTLQEEFNAPEKTGGHKELQSHTHTGSTDATGNHSHSISPQVWKDAGGAGTYNMVAGGNRYAQGLTTLSASTSGNHAHSFTTSSAGTGTGKNLAPYITVYMWKRTG